MTKAEVQDKIKKLEAAIASPATPDAQKEKFRALVKQLKEKEAELTGETKKAEPKPEPKKAEPKKSEPKAETKKAEAKSEKKEPYDCDDLITKEKERKKKQKEAAAKRAKEPTHTPATKNKLAIEKVAERIEKNINKRIEKGDVKKDELKRLIAETEKLLNNLRAKLKTI